jgi:hypothetical protein
MEIAQIKEENQSLRRNPLNVRGYAVIVAKYFYIIEIWLLFLVYNLFFVVTNSCALFRVVNTKRLSGSIVTL